MTGTDDRYDPAADLATLRESVEGKAFGHKRHFAALDRVKAEIERLTEERLEHEVNAIIQHGRKIEYRQRAEAAELALAEACGVIEALAGQQAMPDDFWREPLARFRALAVPR